MMPSRAFLISLFLLLAAGLAAVLMSRPTGLPEIPLPGHLEDVQPSPKRLDTAELYALFHECEKHLKERKKAGEDIHLEWMAAYDDIILAVAEQDDPELLKQLKISKAIQMARRECELALQQYNTAGAQLARVNLYDPATYKTSDSIDAVKQVLNQLEAAANRFWTSEDDYPERRNHFLRSMQLTEDEIAQVEKIFDNAQRSAIFRSLHECDRQFVAGVRSMVELIVEATGECRFLPDGVIQFASPQLQMRMIAIKKELVASQQQREQFNLELQPLIKE